MTKRTIYESSDELFVFDTAKECEIYEQLCHNQHKGFENRKEVTIEGEQDWEYGLKLLGTVDNSAYCLVARYNMPIGYYELWKATKTSDGIELSKKQSSSLDAPAGVFESPCNISWSVTTISRYNDAVRSLFKDEISLEDALLDTLTQEHGSLIYYFDSMIADQLSDGKSVVSM